MNLINKIAIFSSFLGLWTVSFLNPQFQTILGFVLILTFGILHGANDLLIFSQFGNKSIVKMSKILTRYIFFIIVVSVMFYIIPAFSLICFVLISGLHFGQQHFENYTINVKSNLINFFYLIYGLFILFLLFLINIPEVISVVQSITAYQLTANSIIYTFWFITFLLIVTTIYILIISQEFKNNIFQELFYILVFVIIFNSTSLIWGFALYFIFWHSLPSINSQVIFIYGNNQLQNFLNYAKSGFLYWLLAIIGLLVANFYFSELKIFNAIFFSFLAAITFPHVIVMYKMFDKK